MILYLIVAIAFGAYSVGQVITDQPTVDGIIAGTTPRLNYALVVAGYPQIRVTTT